MRPIPYLEKGRFGFERNSSLALRLKAELFSNKLFEGIESIVELHPRTKELILEERVY